MDCSEKKKKSIGIQIIALSNLLRRQADQISDGGMQITGMQGFVVGHLFHAARENRAVYQKDIEKLLNVSRSTTSGLLNLMEKRELIRRSAVLRDARLKQVTLTETAMAIQEKVCGQLDLLDEQLKSCLSEEEQAQFFALTDKIHQYLMEQEQLKKSKREKNEPD